jgi:hypothetical protein
MAMFPYILFQRDPVLRAVATAYSSMSTFYWLLPKFYSTLYLLCPKFYSTLYLQRYPFTNNYLLAPPFARA